MISKERRAVAKGSWGWALNVAEATAWGTVALILLTIHLQPLPSSTYRLALAVTAGLIVWLVLSFLVLLPEARRHLWPAAVAVAGTMGFAIAIFAILRSHIGSIQLVMVPVVAMTGLLSRPSYGLVAGGVATVAYYAVAALSGDFPGPASGILNAGVFLLSGFTAGLLAQELRLHYRGEQEEHHLATAVRHRLMAVLDTVGEAILFRDRQGVTRVVNQQAGTIFDLDPDAFLGQPVVELLRTIARRTEDPEGFMETFQELRDEPDAVLRIQVEQIMPQRRQLRLYSTPIFDDAGALVGRIDVFTDITESVARAAEVERLYEEARRTAESYQRSLLPRATPNLPRISTVARYIPAAGSRAVCGDFYDFVSLVDGRMGVVLGDVCGIGPAAASDAALARYTLRSFAGDERDPGRVFERMNEHVCRQITSDHFLRLLFGAIDPERAIFEYVNAGHVPPVVYRARSGEVEWLGEGGIAMGIEPNSSYKVGRIEMEPGDMLVLYTDGVTEAPRNGRPFGQGKFSDIVQLYGVGTPGELVQAIRRAVEAWVGQGELRDDLAMLVCQVVPDATIADLVRELVLPNEIARIGEVRSFVASFLADLRAPVEASQDILLAVGEAAANSARHGRRKEGRSELRIRCLLEERTVHITIADDGTGFDPARVEAAVPDRFASGGRGLFLMRALMDEVSIESTPRGTTVVLIREVLEPEAA